MANQLPNELIVEILSRLPSKSLIRFQSVCKSWRSLITSTEFRLMHFHNFNKPNPRYLVRRFELRENREVYTVYLDDQLFMPTPRLNSPSVLPVREYTTKDEVILWNPAVRRNVTLIPPIFPNSYWKDLYLVLGFGYDTVSDDYKVVRVAYDGLFFSSRPHVEIYTVKTAVWRVVTFPDDLCCFFICPNHSYTGTLIALRSTFRNERSRIGYNRHHLIRCLMFHARYSIMTFDMSTEGFGEIELPKDLPLLPTTKVVVTVVGEFLGRVLQVRNNEDLITESGCGDLTIYNRETCHYVYTSSMRIMLEDTLFVDRYQESLALLDAERDAILDEAKVEEGQDERFDDESLARYEARYLIQLFGE
ncbi:hypothetical protein OSB04_013145 [Centaurea solstitialis]|uniref:F-box domain-containing protein n=1 Tax=Centaurea solstitialis TaxID=347529 RepID=A0AA38WR38_9ASTR|nr:hypothetical protein OSB04_013145 [Centaurea solstitialis]